MERHLLFYAFAASVIVGMPNASSAQALSPNANLADVIAQYRAGSDLVRPALARQIDRAARRLPVEPETASLRAQAAIVMSQQAARDQRKDLALAQAKLATSLSGSLEGADGKVVRAHAAIAMTRALILQQDFVTAMTTIVSARRAYGPLIGELDPLWDELLLWGTLAHSSAPEYLNAQIQALNMTDEEEVALKGVKGRLCDDTQTGIERNRDEGRQPIYPVISWFSDLQGGVIMRSQIGSDGKVISTRASAFSPSEGFAAAAEIAMPTWTYQVPANTPRTCRENFLTVLTFRIQ